MTTAPCASCRTTGASRKYKYDDRTVRLVQDNWGFALEQWKYEI